MLDIIAAYAKKWRFELNPKKSSCVWDPKSSKKPGDETWTTHTQNSQTIQILRNRINTDTQMACLHQENTGKSETKHDTCVGDGDSRRICVSQNSGDVVESIGEICFRVWLRNLGRKGLFGSGENPN